LTLSKVSNALERSEVDLDHFILIFDGDRRYLEAYSGETAGYAFEQFTTALEIPDDATVDVYADTAVGGPLKDREGNVRGRVRSNRGADGSIRESLEAVYSGRNYGILRVDEADLEHVPDMDDYRPQDFPWINGSN